jgi:hypothetical protein
MVRPIIRLLTTYLPDYQDSFVSGPRINVTWFSWLTAVAEIGTGLVLGYAALRSLRATGRGDESRCKPGELGPVKQVRNVHRVSIGR